MPLKRIWSPSNALRRSASAHSSSPRRRLSIDPTQRRSGGTRRGWWPDIIPTRRLFIRSGVGGCPKPSGGSTTRAAPSSRSAFAARRTSAGSWMRCERVVRFRSHTIPRMFRRRSGPKAASRLLRRNCGGVEGTEPEKRARGGRGQSPHCRSPVEFFASGSRMRERPCQTAQKRLVFRRPRSRPRWYRFLFKDTQVVEAAQRVWRQSAPLARERRARNKISPPLLAGDFGPAT